MSDPAASIPQRAGGWAEALGTYRLLHNERVAPEGIQRGVVERTRRACAGSSLVLCVHDLTELAPSCELSETKLQQHTTLAVAGDDSHAVHGVLGQRWFDDPKPPAGETRRQRRARWKRSDVWPAAVRAIGEPTGATRWIDVCDREADDFAVFHACAEVGHGFVIRSQHDRYIAEGGKLRAAMDARPAAGVMDVSVRKRQAVGTAAPPNERRAAQPRRVARVEVRHASWTLQPPRQDPRYDRPVPVRVVRACEIDPPTDAEPLDWMLLTSEPIESFEDARRVIGWYRRRWLVEEFHKAQKTGCRLERSQLRDAAAFRCLAAITAPVAARMLQLRQQADDEHAAEQPADRHADPLWVEVVARLAGHEQPRTLTLKQFYRTIARQGGWLARRHDGRPGWQTLWRGQQRIAHYIAGIRLLPMPTHHPP